MTDKQKAAAVLQFMEEEWDSTPIINALNPFLKDEDLASLYDKFVGDGIIREPEETTKKVMVLYEVCEDDNTKTSIVAMSESDWQNRKAETIEKVLRDYYDERYSDCDDDYFDYNKEIADAVEALTTGYETEFSGDSVFWDEVEII